MLCKMNANFREKIKKEDSSTESGYFYVINILERWLKSGKTLTYYEVSPDLYHIDGPEAAICVEKSWVDIVSEADGSKKYDSEKQRLLIPEICVREILCSGSLYTYAQIFQQIDEPVMNILKGIQEVLLFGAKKYGPNTWQGLPEAHERYISAWYRHSIKDGNDPESGLPHKYHCWCNLMFLLWNEMKEGGESERYMSQQCSYEKDLRDAKDVLAKAYISGVISKEVIDAAVREIEVVEERERNFRNKAFSDLATGGQI